MNRQRGGAFRVSGWIALLLLALAVGEAASIRHLYRHRRIEITLPVPHAASGTYSKDADSGIFPDGADVCDNFFAICWKTA